MSITKLSLQRHSGAYLGIFFLFGLFFFQALTHLSGGAWFQELTIAFYMLLMLWLAVLLYNRWDVFFPLNRIDILFMLFIIFVLASLILRGYYTAGVIKFSRYFFPMAIAPYLCGRMMQRRDLQVLPNLILVLGLVTLIVMLVGEFTSEGHLRGAFSGLKHGALLCGAILASALLAGINLLLGDEELSRNRHIVKRLWIFVVICVLTISLVWTTARGWLITGLLGVALIILFARREKLWIKLALLVGIYSVAWLALTLLLVVDAYVASKYSRPIDLGKTYVSLDPTPRGGVVPILGAESCDTLRSNNTFAVRWLLYQEAYKQFLDNPLLGVGAARFGLRSCAGLTMYPHNTLLQGFAELGIMGGGLLVLLLGMAAYSLLRSTRRVHDSRWRHTRVFVLAVFGIFVIADQVYGNYFISTGTWLFTGVAAGVMANAK